MKIQALTVCGAALVFVGALWTGQGLGYIGGSFMTGSMLWVVIGLIVALVGIGLLVRSRRRRP
jgi:hypothetical protein